MEEMISNSYVALLDQDTVLITHPLDKNKRVKLYRIVALKSFKLLDFDISIRQGTVGGLVEGLHNLDPDSPVWVANRARVFDNAKIMYGSLVTDSCVVFGNAEIRASRLKNYARVHGRAQVIDSTLSDLVEVKDNATVLESTMENSTMAFNNANLQRCHLKVGSCARGNVIAIDTVLDETTQIGGDARLINCKLLHDAKVFDGRHEDQTFDDETELKYEAFDGNLNDLQPVSFTFEGHNYNGYAWLIPGKSRSIVYSDSNGKNVLKTRTGMNLTITSEDLFGKPTF